MENTIESLFVEKYLQIEKENKDLKQELEHLKDLFKILKLEYVPSSNSFIRALKVFTGDNLETAVIGLVQNNIPVANIDKYFVKEEEKKAKEEVQRIAFKDVVAIVKKRLMHTDESLGQKVGVTQGSISQYINGKSLPRKEIRDKILALWETVATEEEKKYMILN